MHNNGDINVTVNIKGVLTINLLDAMLLEYMLSLDESYLVKQFGSKFSVMDYADLFRRLKLVSKKLIDTSRVLNDSINKLNENTTITVIKDSRE